MQETTELAKKWSTDILNIYQAYLQVKNGTEAKLADRAFRTVGDIVNYCLDRSFVMQTCSTICVSRDKKLVMVMTTYAITMDDLGPSIRLTGELDDSNRPKPITARIEIIDQDDKWSEFDGHGASGALLWLAQLLLNSGG